MLKTLQTVGWSLLSPVPVDLEGDVVCLLGENGSGKSSTLDAVKAVFGASRFGRDRAVSSYRYAGRAGAAPARAAYVLCVVSNRTRDGAPRLVGYSSELTLVMEAGASRRRFLVLDGRVLLPHDERLDCALRALREQHPRSAWLDASEYARRVLEPLGIGPAFRRLLELPQGELARVLDREPRALVGLLVELSGGSDAADAFERARAALEQARDRQAEAARRLDRRRAQLAELMLEQERARRAAELRATLAGLRLKAETLLASVPPAQAKTRSADERQPERISVLDRRRLSALGIELVLCDGVWAVADADVERVRELLAPGETLPRAADGLGFLLERGALVCGVTASRHADVRASSRETRSEDAAPTVGLRELKLLRGAIATLDQLGVEAEEQRDVADDEEWDAGGLAGAIRALAASWQPNTPEHDPDRISAFEALLAADEEQQRERDEILGQATAQLSEARDRYRDALERSFEVIGERFSALCAQAGLRGRLELELVGVEPRLVVHAAESAEEELRPLVGAQASLSGGWKTTVLVLCVLACLEAEGSPPALLLDEVGSSLDEPRLAALGCAFARLAASRDLQTVMTLPSRVQSETVAEFADLQIGFFRPLPDEPLAPPPHSVSCERRLAA